MSEGLHEQFRHSPSIMEPGSTTIGSGKSRLPSHDEAENGKLQRRNFVHVVLFFMSKRETLQPIIHQD